MDEAERQRQEQLDMMADNQRRQRELDDFLSTIREIESSGGKDLEHPIMEKGIHKGQSAIGQYGLMPQTIQEVARRSNMRDIASIPAEQMSEKLTPELEQQIAGELGRRVLDRQQDPEQAAYSWFMGHNLLPEQVQQANYQEHPYVQKFKRIRESLK